MKIKAKDNDYVFEASPEVAAELIERGDYEEVKDKPKPKPAKGKAK